MYIHTASPARDADVSNINSNLFNHAHNKSIPLLPLHRQQDGTAKTRCKILGLSDASNKRPQTRNQIIVLNKLYIGQTFQAQLCNASHEYVLI